MKKLLCLLCLMLCGCLLYSCGEAKEVVLSDVASEINSQFNLTGLTEIKDVQELQSIYQIDPADVKQFFAEYKTDSAEGYTEIVIVEAVNSDAVQNIKAKLENRFIAVYTDFSSNAPDMLGMVKNCSVNVDGNYVSLFICENSGEMHSTFKHFI